MNDDKLLEIINLSLATGGGWIQEFHASFSRGSIALLISEEPRKISSLFHVLAGLGSPKDGTITYHGTGVGMVLVEDDLPHWSNPDQELSLYSTLSGIRRGQLNENVAAWEVDGIYKLPIHHLNAYEKKALFLAMETAAEPDLLLCEEPLQGLNSEQTHQMLRHLIRYANTHLVLIGTINPLLFPEEIPRIFLDHRKIRSWEESYNLWLNEEGLETDSDSAGQTDDSFANFKSGANLPTKDFDSEPVTSTQAILGDKKQITVHVNLPIDVKTDYELRRIAEIKFFEPSDDGTGYDLDILEENQDQLNDLLAARGLALSEEEADQ